MVWRNIASLGTATGVGDRISNCTGTGVDVGLGIGVDVGSGVGVAAHPVDKIKKSSSPNPISRPEKAGLLR